MHARSLILALALSVGIGLTAVAGALAQERPTTYRTAAGHWTSPGCQPAGTGASQANLILQRKAATLALTVYADPECATKLFTIAVGSTYQLRGRSPDVEGARIARFSFHSRQVTPHTRAIADAMNDARCGGTVSRVGFATDVFATGCAPVGQPSERACPVEYELLKRTRDQLFLGARPADGRGLCTPDRQATTLGPGLVQG